MSQQWQRIIRVTVSGKGGSATFDGTQTPNPGFEIGFSGTKTIGSKQNTFNVDITNLSKSSRNKMGEEWDQLILEFGYKSTGASVLFKGAIRDVSHSKDSNDITTTIECGDGDKGVNKGAVSKTFPKGTKPKEVAEYLQKNMPGVDKGKMEGLDDLPAFKRPVSVFGYAASEMDTLGRQFGFYWNIHNEKMNTVKNDKHLGEAVIISSETGLIGVPTETDKGLKFKCLANPRIVPAFLCDVRSNFLDEGSGRDKRQSDYGGGIIRVSSAAFSGHSRSDEYFCEVEGNRVQGDKVAK